MDLSGFRDYLAGREFGEDVIAGQLAIVERFGGHLAGLTPPLTIGTATPDAALGFIAGLIESAENTQDNLAALARAGYFFQNNALYIAVLELLDGAEALGNMHRLLAEEFGVELRDRVFADGEVPPLGGDNLQKARANRAVVKRLAAEVGEAGCARFLSRCMRDLPDSMYEADRELYARCADIDEFLEMKREQNVAMLTELRDKGALFFSQEVTTEMIEHVRSNPEIMVGNREGGTLYVTKIPYMTKEHLAAEDERDRRYYYCHCPWARELIRRDEEQVPAVFCNCSGGFSKKRWEAIFGRELEVELLESVLKGDQRCRFAIRLPEE